MVAHICASGPAFAAGKGWMVTLKSGDHAPLPHELTARALIMPAVAPDAFRVRVLPLAGPLTAKPAGYCHS
ncbi:hypothetical protein DSECCO2_307130 [anaerobic digester metagenome]